jgi:hydrogenase maturation protease
MRESRPFRMCVLGLGNLMRTDDALGMLTLQRLTADARFPESVEPLEGATLGLDLLHALYGVSHLLVLDAVDAGAEPGTLLRFAGDDLVSIPTSKSVHLLGLSDILSALTLMNAQPVEAVLLGVQPHSTDWGTALTPAVAEGQSALIEAAITQLAQWSSNATNSMNAELPAQAAG